MSLHDLEAEDIAHLDDEMDAAYPASIESSIRNHPSAQEMSEPEISSLAQELIDELRQRHVRRRKARAIFAVIQNPALSSEDRSAIALEAGLPVNVFNEQSATTALDPKGGGGSRKYEQQETSDFVDFGKLAANDRD
ncbi:hypothetical protein D3C87_1548970 [compost metagenome]